MQPKSNAADGQRTKWNVRRLTSLPSARITRMSPALCPPPTPRVTTALTKPLKSIGHGILQKDFVFATERIGMG